MRVESDQYENIKSLYLEAGKSLGPIPKFSICHDDSLGRQCQDLNDPLFNFEACLVTIGI